MKIYVCQTTPKICDLENNFTRIQELYLKSQELQADICLFPELALPGYMARDFFTYNEFVKSVEKYNKRLVEITSHTCLLLPTITLVDKMLHNSVIAAQGGQIIGITHKASLPAYGIFEEPRYFKPGKPSVIKINNRNIGVPICADIWVPQVCNELKEQGAEIFLVPNASPFDRNKFHARYSVLRERYSETNIPLIYCNQVIAQDGIIFEGRSVCYDGELKNIGAAFSTSEQMVYFADAKLSCESYEPSRLNMQEDILDALVMGVRSYVQDNNFQKVLLGLSGGIDSAVVAYIAVKALGRENVRAYMLPSVYTSNESRLDAKELADKLGVNLHNIDIDDICVQFIESLGGVDQILEGTITHQNIQSRVRGTILMAESNKHNALLLTTGNKSEYATGYATIYGDMNGAFNPIKDLYKTEIYQLVAYINEIENIIPQRIIDKPPSAELKPLQKDSDSLGSYKILDEILKDHIENRKSFDELSIIHDPSLVQHILRLVNNAEFKRQQSAPGVKISENIFGLERRVPITHYLK
jgi:NAD+ synthase